MKLLLAMDTSWNRPRVVLGDGANLPFDSHSHPNGAEAPPQDLSAQVSGGLDALGAEVRDIGAIAVNVGPGGLSSIRTGVAFSNALAFSLGIPVYPFHYFEIVAKQVNKITTLPTLAAAPAAGDLAYVALLRGGGVEAMRFGPLPAAVEKLGAGLEEVAVAGRLRPRLLHLLQPATVTDTMAEWPDCRVLFEMGLTAREQQAAPAMGPVTPLTEESEVFADAP